MGFTGERAFQWKLDYIEAFNRMEATLRQPQAQPFDPNDPAALRTLLIGYSERLLLARAETAEVKQELTVVQAVVEEQRPMVDAYLAFLDDDGLCNLRTAARAVDAPCMLFLRWMEERKYVIRENGGELQPAAAMRRDGSKADIYYHAPDGDKCRSMPEGRRLLERERKSGAPPQISTGTGEALVETDFNFRGPPQREMSKFRRIYFSG